MTKVAIHECLLIRESLILAAVQMSDRTRSSPSKRQFDYRQMEGHLCDSGPSLLAALELEEMGMGKCRRGCTLSEFTHEKALQTAIGSRVWAVRRPNRCQGRWAADVQIVRFAFQPNSSIVRVARARLRSRPRLGA